MRSFDVRSRSADRLTDVTFGATSPGSTGAVVGPVSPANGHRLYQTCSSAMLIERLLLEKNTKYILHTSRIGVIQPLFSVNKTRDNIFKEVHSQPAPNKIRMRIV